VAETEEDLDRPAASWVLRAANRSPGGPTARLRAIERAQAIVDAARRLIDVKGSEFTTHQLVREAGIAIQTLYKYFASKDDVILAALEDMVVASCVQMEEAGASFPDPVERLRFYVFNVISSLDPKGTPGAGRFIAAEHWRLVQLYPEEVATATRPVAEILARQLRAAEQAGLLAPADIDYGAWLGNQLLLSVYHNYTFAKDHEPAELIAEKVWLFLLGAWGGGPVARPPEPSSAEAPRAPANGVATPH
jgi:TetR/AcrR family transcriptional regulator